MLKSLSSASPESVVAVNASLWKRAPEVGRFLELYEWDGDLLTTESKKIKSGGIAVTAASGRSQRVQAPRGSVDALGVAGGR